jgi:TRAP-type uncharacterized transport system fused permease subunit
MRYGHVAFFIPFLFAENPALMGLGSPSEILWAAVGGLFASTMTAAFLQGYLITKTTLLDRALLLASAVCFTAFVLHPEPLRFGGGLILLAATAAKQGGWAAFPFLSRGAGAADPPRQ